MIVVNKKVLIIIAGILILLFSGWYFISSKKTSPLTTDSENQGGVKSLKDLLSSAIAQKCTFSETDESGNSEGTTYVSGGKVRADFSTTASEKTVKSHMISDGKTSYIWTDGEKNGFKMTVNEPTPSSAKTDSSDTSVNSEGDLDQKADYKCSGWVVDGSYFIPPSNITFTDFSQTLNPSSDASQCSYCNTLSDDDKTQCLATLNCK